ncbi:MAG: glycosyltransferase family A protein [Candidatus Acidiferrales bacterium]
MSTAISDSPKSDARSVRKASLAKQRTNERLSTVDVVIPSYNYARYLSGCVASVLEQPEVEVRVLIIDDASSDNTAQVGEALAASDSRVEFCRHKVNKGNIATYNEGLIDWSTADYTVLLSADDLLAPGSLGRAVRIMNADDRIGMVYGSTIHFKQESELPRASGWKFAYNRWSGAEWLNGRCRAGHNVITSPEVVVRGIVQRAVGGYRPELPHAGDLEMWLRIAAVSDIAYVRHVPQAYYRVHPHSMMRTVYKGSFLDLRQRKEAFDAFFRHHRHIVTETDRLYESANRALAREALWDACRAYDRNQVEASSAEQLIEFARSTYAGVSRLPEYSALLRRQTLGPILCNRTQVFAVPALVRKIRRWALKERWKRQGV